MIFNEHVHMLRAPRLSRKRDPVWLTCTICVLTGLGGSLFLTAAAPRTQLEHMTKQCEIRLTMSALISFGVFLFAVGLYLAVILFRMIWLALKSHDVSISTRTSTYTERRLSFLSVSRDGKLQENEWSRKRTTIVLCKNLVGWTAMLVIAAINMAVYLTHDGAKKSHICLLICLTDGKCVD